MSNKLTTAVLAVARKEVGVREDPLRPNWGEKKGPTSEGTVAEYIRAAGYDSAVFWCMCFVYWCLLTAVGKDRAKVFPRTGSCDRVLEWARGNGILFENPEPGDVGLVMASARDATHTFYVDTVTGNVIGTIEGNSNDDGSNNGYEVCKRTRKLVGKRRLLFVRWANLIPGADTFPSAPTAPAPWKLIVNMRGAFVTVAGVEVDGAGSTIVPARALLNQLKGADLTQTNLSYDAADNALEWGETTIPVTVTRRGGTTFAPVRKLAEWAGYTVSPDAKTRTITMVKGG